MKQTKKAIQMWNENIREKVYSFKTKNKEGFVQSEIEKNLQERI
jgi:hypothetical protein